MVGHNLPSPDWNRFNISENLVKAAVLPDFPVITGVTTLS